MTVRGTTMRNIAAVILLLAAASGCRKAKPVLYVYNWDDYIKPELVERFEREHECRVLIDTYDSNETMYGRLAAGAGPYDLLVPSSYMVNKLKDEGRLQEIRHEKIPNLKHVDPEYLAIAIDPRMKQSVPYMLTNTGIGYLKGEVPDFTPSWSVFGREDLRGRMTMLDDMRETLGAALKSLGFSINTRSERELAAARDVVLAWKQNLAKFENEQYAEGLASGEFVVAHGYNGDILQAREQNADIAFAAPREGTIISCDDLVIPADARNPDLAHAFINFLHDPEVAAENVEYVHFLCPNKSCYRHLRREILNNPGIFLDPEIRARSEIIRDLGEDTARYEKVWAEIKDR